MRPELFRLLDVGVPAYFLLLLTGFAFATAITMMRARRLGQDPDVIVDLALTSLFMGMVGARIAHVLFDGYFWDYVHLCTDPSLVDWQISKIACESERYQGVWDQAKQVCHPVEADCWQWANVFAGGLTYYGGFILGAFAGIRLLKRDRFPVLKACDMAAVGISVGLGFGRTGCLLAGCCFGATSQSAVALSFPPHSPASDAQHKLEQLDSAAIWSHAVLPTQVMEALMAFGVAGVLMFYLQGRKRYDGQVFVWFLVLYAAGRFVLEFFRADARGGAIGFSTSQLIGIVIIALAGWLHYRLRPTSKVSSA